MARQKSDALKERPVTISIDVRHGLGSFEIDAAFEKVELIRFGDVTPTPTPERAGARIRTLQRAPK